MKSMGFRRVGFRLAAKVRLTETKYLLNVLVIRGSLSILLLLRMRYHFSDIRFSKIFLYQICLFLIGY